MRSDVSVAFVSGLLPPCTTSRPFPVGTHKNSKSFSGVALSRHKNRSSLYIPHPDRGHGAFVVCSAVENSEAASTEWASLDVERFDTKLADKQMPICFVGMSNCGKSHWSNQLQRGLGFHVVSVDEEIEKAIEPELSALGFSGIDGLAEWMGFPSDDRFAVNQARYLSIEESITANARPVADRNSVLDTTGSVIYLNQSTISRVQQDYLVVHLEASDDMLEFMTTNYFENPKPVVWGDIFNQERGETANAALRRCYPTLLQERRKRYATMAHVTIPARVSLSRETSLNSLLDYIRAELRSRSERLVV